MGEERLKVDYDYFEEYCSFDDLKQAASILSISSEDEFNEIKNKKWFNRIYDAITFSKDNEKRVASEIQTLTQAQQLYIEILVRLSERDQQVSSLVEQCYGQIETLSEQDIQLAKKLRELQDRILLGIGKQSNIKDLSDRERVILGGILYYLGSNNEYIPSDNQKKYAHIILSYLGVDGQEINLSSSIESIRNIDSKKKILMCCMEYLFLYNTDLSYLDNFNTLYEEFDFGHKTINEIKNIISNTYQLRGVQGFIDKYNQINKMDEDSFLFDIHIPETIEEEVNLEEITIDQGIYISENEEKIISYKEIHIIAYIHCNGRLVFENCYIHYNEEDISQQIIVSEGAQLIFNNCIIDDCNKMKRYFIEAEKGSNITFYDCKLSDCAYFIKCNTTQNLIFDKCEINNPSELFIYGITVSGKISECKLYFTKSVYKAFPDAVKNTSIICLEENNKEHSFIINATNVIGSDEYYKEYHPVFIFYISDADYEGCIFQNLHGTSIVGYHSIKNCQFIDCLKPILASQQSSTPASVLNCVFDGCHEAILIWQDDYASFRGSKKYIFSNCHFNDCDGKLLSALKIAEGKNVQLTDIEVTLCEFNKCRIEDEDRSLILFDELLGFFDIHKCLFNDIKLKNAFLVSTKVYVKPPKPPGKISDCTFKACKTNNSKGIINEYGEYETIFGNIKTVKVVSVENCKNI